MCDSRRLGIAGLINSGIRCSDRLPFYVATEGKKGATAPNLARPDPHKSCKSGEKIF
jgi:hypothetical protein